MLIILALAAISNSARADDSIRHWTKSGPGASEFLIQIDSTRAYSGERSIKIKSGTADPAGFVTLMQEIRAFDYRGNQVQLTAWVKTENVTNAHIWMRVDSLRRYLAIDAMEGRRINGTNDWFPVSIVLDVSEGAEIINVGAVHDSDGTLWVDDFRLSVPDKVLESTNVLEGQPLFENQTKPRPVDHLAFRLRNGGFESSE